MNLGEKLKYYRKLRGLTIRDLADKSNLSIGFISNLERDINSPSISNLQQLCRILDINLVELIQPLDEKTFITKKDNRKEIFTNDNNNIIYELLTPTSQNLNCICITLKGNSNYGKTSWGHNHDEIGLVTKGSLELELDGNIHILNEGDLVYIDKLTPHKYSNTSDEECISYWFSSENT